MSSASDLTPLLRHGWDAGSDVGFRQGTVAAWNAETGENTVLVGGTEIHDLPILVQSEKLAIQVGDVVALTTSKGQMYVQGRLRVDDGAMFVRSASGQVQVQIGRSPAGGGQVVTYHPNGTTGVMFGELTIAGDPVGHGFFVQQDDGVDVFGAGPIVEGGPTLVRVTDPLGNLVMTTKEGGGWSLRGVGGGVVAATDDDTPSLLDRPYMDIPMYGQNSTGDLRYPGTTFQAIWSGRMRHTHAGIHAQAQAWVSSPSTLPTAQVRLMVNGVQVGSTFTTSSSTPTMTDFGGAQPLAALGLSSYSAYRVDIEARISANSGADRLVSVLAYGVTKRGTP